MIRGRLVALGLSASAALALPAPGADPDARLRSLAAAIGQGEPLMRIGLEPAARVTLASVGPFRVLDPATGGAVWHGVFTGELQVIADGGAGSAGSGTVFRVQAGAFQSEDAARAALAGFEESAGVPGVVQHDPDRHNWRVRLGAASDRLELAPVLERLRAAGASGAFIAEEGAEAPPGVTLRLVDASWTDRPTALRRLVVVPDGRAHLEVQGKRYRGLVELRIDRTGKVRPVNWVELEQYLLGVVPAELGPDVWPQIEALRAQAVAARTYAWRNQGQFGAEGFDLCATPRCQVYEGLSVEHPLSDRAVWSTRGEVASWQGRPIQALYTATCGGHTEDDKEIFPSQDEPYLQPVRCRAETDALATQRAALTGRPPASVIDETGTDVTRDVALLLAAGVLAADDVVPERLREPAAGERLRQWTRALARLAGRPMPAEPVEAIPSVGRAAAMLLSDLGWSERAALLLSPEDAPALLRDAATDGLPDRERRALAYLALMEGLHAFPDGTFHGADPPTLPRLAPALLRIGESYAAFGIEAGVFAGRAREGVRLWQGKEELRVPLDAGAALFGSAAGRPVAVDRLTLWPGDRLRFRVGAGGRVDFLELEPPVKGVDDDRSAKVYSWEVRKSREELEAAIGRRLSVGRLRDLQVVRRGVSGRVVELRVVGAAGDALVRGFDVRTLLDVRESLAVLEIQRTAGGEITGVVLAGKGWGHGVGLCQVGAYGMALRGSDYREILAHYYRGTTLTRLPTSGPP